MDPVYIAKFENVAVSAAQDLFEIQVSARWPVTLHHLFLYNVGADVGDAQEENLRLTIRYLSQATPGSGGSAVASYRARMRTGSPTTQASATVAANNTTVATTAALNLVRAVGGWNIRMPFERVWTPETRLTFTYNAADDESGMCVVRLEGAPADAISMTGELAFEEFAA